MCCAIDPPAYRSKLGYRSLLLTGSMVGGLGVFGHDDAVGFAGEEEQGGREGFQSRKVGEKARCVSLYLSAYQLKNGAKSSSLAFRSFSNSYLAS